MQQQQHLHSPAVIQLSRIGTVARNRVVTAGQPNTPGLFESTFIYWQYFVLQPLVGGPTNVFGSYSPLHHPPFTATLTVRIGGNTNIALAPGARLSERVTYAYNRP